MASLASVVVRFAPSPTGFLHIGSLRTALFNWLWARKNNGKFILRIEDTDQTRLVPGAVENIQEALAWYGLDVDAGPFFQSQRLDLYRAAAERLIASGHAYYSFETADELTKLREVQRLQGIPIKYRSLSVASLTDAVIQEKIKAGEPYVVRLRVPEEGTTTFDDQVYGTVTVENARIDDQVLLKSDGFPTYHLANVVDDHDMEVTHVIRGEEWLPSTPKHMVLYAAFGWQPPTFCHLPLILGSDKAKLSKRHGAVPALEYRALGYTPKAILNFIALLGWNPKTEQEFFTIQELIEAFELEKLNKSSAVFDVKKLDWLNAHSIRTISPSELLEYARPFIGSYAEHKNILPALDAVRGRVTRLTDLVDDLKIFFEPIDWTNPSLIIAKGEDASQAIQSLTLAREIIRPLSFSELDRPAIVTLFKESIAQHQTSTKSLLWPLRVALSGRTNSPGFDELMLGLGKDETLQRIEKAILLLKK
ncbi:MAG: glutamate--tRNA ligase [Candidatus Kerfeldbacteria bacterium]|nr:glutamate--tRNA ligase [Candidatus Kerfeldbacteria bacterium]